MYLLPNQITFQYRTVAGIISDANTRRVSCR